MLPTDISDLIIKFKGNRMPVLDRLERELTMAYQFTMRCNRMLYRMQHMKPHNCFGCSRTCFKFGGPHRWESWWIRAGVWEPDLTEEEYWEHFKDWNEETNTWSINTFNRCNMLGRGI